MVKGLSGARPVGDFEAILDKLLSDAEKRRN
jgi:hypothetical protein